MRRLSIFSLAVLGLATVHAEAKPRHVHHHGHPARDLASASPEQVVSDLLTAPRGGAAVDNGVVFHARQSQFYGNENFYADNRNWGY